MRGPGMFRVGPSTLAAAAIALLLATAPAPAQPRPSLLNPAEMATVDQLRPGMKGVGKSVFQGTRIESFGVTVLGVLRRVDFGGDLILVRIDSGPPVSKGYGVVAGMSGSPVYVDGKLIGALAYAWSFSKQPIAGVTPIAQMLEDYLPGSAPVASQGTLTATTPFVVDGMRIERATVAPTASLAAQAQAPNTGVLTPIATPLLVSGMNPRTIGLLRTALEPLGLVPLAGAGAMDRVEMTIAPGAAVGARLIGGDLDVTAVGTVTYVKDGVVLAFGHPMALLGKADLPLVAAHVHGIMPSAEMSFKLASAGQTLGRFTEDRPWCLGGVLGERPTLVETRMNVLDGDRKLRRSYQVEVIQDRSLTSMLLIAVLAGAIESVAAGTDGTTRVRFSFEAEGLPRMTRENTYSADGGYGLLSLLFGGMSGTFSATQELSSILDLLQTNPFGETRLLRLWVDAEVSDRRCAARLERVRVARPRVSAGDEVEVEVVLRSAEAGEITRVEKVRIPATCPAGRVRLGVAGGRSAQGLRARLGISQPQPQSLQQMLSQTLGRASNDDLVMQLALPTVGIDARGFALRDLPPAVIDVLRSAKGTQLETLRDYEEWRTPTDWVVSGHEVISLVVEGEEKDKGGRPPGPQYRGSSFDDEGLNFGALFDDVGLGASVLSEEEGDEDEEDEAEGMDLDSPPAMPNWEEVESAGGEDFALRSSGTDGQPQRRDRGDAIGRIASLWRFSTYKEMAAGKCTGAQVASTGEIVLGPEPHVLTAAPSRCVWTVAAASPERVYFGTWGDGCLRSWTPETGAQVVLETSDAAITALAVLSDGTVYAAAAPSGTIYRVSPGGGSEQVCRLDAPYIWALVWHESGLLAGTGPDGTLYRIGNDGHVSAVFRAADRHITALAAGPNGVVYMGTAPRGKVYALSPDGGVRSVCEIEKSSIQSLAAGPDGSVYVGTSPDGRVLRIGPESEVHQLLKVKAKHVLALRVGPDGTVYAGIGPPAGVYAISADESWTQVYDPKSAYVTGLAWAEPGAVYVAVGDTGDIVELDTTAARLGRYDSPVLDAKAISRWGALQWHGVCPDGAGLSLLTRSGGTAFPDGTWSQWQAVPAGQRTTVGSPADRFLQWRAELTGSGPASPRIETLVISYLPANQSPEITLLAPKQSETWSGKKAIRWRGKDPDGDKLSYEVYWSTDRGETWTRIEGVEREATTEAKGASETDSADAPVESAAGDATLRRQPEATTMPDGDDQGVSPMAAVPWPPELAALADEGEDAGKGGAAAGDGEGEEAEPREAGPTASGSQSTTLEWDTTAVADGVYRLKVIASDRAANPGDPKEDGVMSPLLVLDNAPPELVLDRRRTEEDPPPDSVTVFDAATHISSAEFRVDEGEWLAAMPGDGIFDGQLENILLDLARLPEGAHQVEVRARDGAGNVTRGTLRYRR